MHEELSQVSRRFLVNPFAAYGPKEWWYLGVHDPESGTYFSFYIIRLPSLDGIKVTLFQPSTGKCDEFAWKGFLRDQGHPGTMHFQIEGGGCSMAYERVDDNSWRFRFKGKGWDIDLESEQKLPPFVSRESQFEAHYGLLHFFGNHAHGKVRTPSARMDYKVARSYCDHAWGVIPRQTEWYWVAIQNDKLCLASIVNIGPRSQKYTQAYLIDPDNHEVGNRWVRLASEVAFANGANDVLASRWSVASTDLELEVEVLQRTIDRERIPPVIPVVVRIDHHECYVRSWGRIRLDGKWRDTGDMFGVMEIHRGVW